MLTNMYCRPSTAIHFIIIFCIICNRFARYNTHNPLLTMIPTRPANEFDRFAATTECLLRPLHHIDTTRYTSDRWKHERKKLNKIQPFYKRCAHHCYTRTQTCERSIFRFLFRIAFVLPLVGQLITIFCQRIYK